MTALRLAHISDTHFGTEVPAVMEALRSALAALAPDIVLLCGDITQRARRREFAAAGRFFAALPAKAARLAVPGNHDIPLFNVWARVMAPYAGYQRVFGAREALWSRDGVAVLALDATHPRRHKHGRLDPAHLGARLAEARAACGGDGLLVVAAHQPLWTAWGEDQAQTLIGRHVAARLLAEARVDAVLSGHVHVPMIATSAISDPQLPWRFVLSGAGTAVSHRVRPGAPNSFNLLEIGDGGITVERWDCIVNHFARVAQARFGRGDRGWAPAG